MSATFLEKLKEKNTPKMRESVIVAFPGAKQLKEPGQAKSNNPVSIKLMLPGYCAAL